MDPIHGTVKANRVPQYPDPIDVDTGEELVLGKIDPEDVMIKHIRHGFGSVRPYVYGHLDLWDMVRLAFDAIEVERHQMGPKSFHIEARIGDSMIILETGDPPHPDGTPGSIYVYVPDVDEAFRRALECGAASITTPEDKPYDERSAGVRDSFGNTWWIATYRK